MSGARIKRDPHKKPKKNRFKSKTRPKRHAPEFLFEVVTRELRARLSDSQKEDEGSRAEAGRDEVFIFHTFCAAAPSRLTELKRGVLGGDASAASSASSLGVASLAEQAICSRRISKGVSPVGYMQRGAGGWGLGAWGLGLGA